MGEWVGSHGYVTTKNGLKHREIMKPGGDEVVHHIDGNKLNNNPSNLLVFKNQAEHAKYHMMNNRVMDGKGKVWRDKSKNPEMKCWEVRIMFNGKRKRLGLYEDPISAQLVYDLVWEELNAVQKE